MDPTAAEIKNFKNIVEIAAWIGFEDSVDKDGVEREAYSSFLSGLGSPAYVRQLVAIPADAWTAAILAWEVKVNTKVDGETKATFVNPTPVEMGHVGALRRIARLVMGLGSEQVPVQTETLALTNDVTSLPTNSPGIATLGQRILMSKVLNQNSDSEVVPLSADTLRGLLDDWIANINEGEEPTEEEEATSDQLSSLDALAKAGAIPFVDFGVWRPFGNRLGKALRFVIQVEKADGTRQSKEINGPDSFDVWMRCWTVFVFAMTALKLASKTRLQRYADRIKRLNDEFPRFWWIIGQADIRMRSEHLERIRRDCVKRQAAGALTDYDPTKPWDVAFREAAASEAFWQREVDKRVLQFAAVGLSVAALTDEGFGTIQLASSSASQGGRGSQGAAKKTKDNRSRTRSRSPYYAKATRTTPRADKRAAKERRKAKQPLAIKDLRTPAPTHTRPSGKGEGKAPRAPDDKRANGRFYRSKSGVEICFAYSRHGNCANPCPNGRAHVCEICRETHPNKECKQ